MESKSLEDRVVLLENEMQSLRGLPDRVASLEEQFVQFRGEVRGEFSALRVELRQLSVEMHALNGAAMSEMRVLFENAIERIKTIRRG